MSINTIIVLDIKPTGAWIPGRGYDDHNQPIPLEIAIQSYDLRTRELTDSVNLVIRKPNATSPNLTRETIKLHGISEEERAHGASPKDISAILSRFIGRDDIIVVGHSLGFDLSTLKHYLYVIKDIKNLEKVSTVRTMDTMYSSVEFARLPRKDHGYGFKRPSLVELHQVLFHEPLPQPASLVNDVSATARCFFELARQKVNLLPTVMPRSSGAFSVKELEEMFKQASSKPDMSSDEREFLVKQLNIFGRFGDKYLMNDYVQNRLTHMARHA